MKGRPSKYTEEFAKEICTRLSLGESLRSICDSSPHLPHRATILRWVSVNESNFYDQYMRARDSQAHTHVDEMLDLRQLLLDGELDPQAARAIADITKWSAERMGRKSFGKDKQEEKPQEPQAITINLVDAKKPDAD